MTLSLRLGEKHVLREYENNVLRRIFGTKKEKAKGSFRKMHNEKFHNLYSLPGRIRMRKSRRMEWAGHVTRMVKKNAYRISEGSPE
jgi:hypothetical protein